MEANKKLNPIVNELFLRGKKTKYVLVFISQSYSKLPKTIKLNTTHCIMKIQRIASNHSSDNDFKDFMKLYKDHTKEPYSFLVNDKTLSPDNPLRFRKKLL